MTPASAASGQSPLVTIITATYNSSYTLRCTLKSIQAQSFNNFEALVIGDHCTDDSASAVSELQDPRFRWINLPHRIGTQSGPNNEGLRQARGEYIAYLGHDDLWFPWHLASLVATLESTHADFVHAGIFYIYPKSRIELVGSSIAQRTYAQRLVPPSSWLHRRSIVERSGYWPLPEGQIDGVDFLFQQQAARAGVTFTGTGGFSVLKFPSISWSPYNRSEGLPEPQCLERMQKDAPRLHHDLLCDFASLAAAERDDMPLRTTLRHLSQSLFYWFKDTGARDHWLLKPLFILRMKRLRKAYARRRGLS
jgi:hypothetical protein